MLACICGLDTTQDKRGRISFPKIRPGLPGGEYRHGIRRWIVCLGDSPHNISIQLNAHRVAIREMYCTQGHCQLTLAEELTNTANKLWMRLSRMFQFTGVTELAVTLEAGNTPWKSLNVRYEAEPQTYLRELSVCRFCSFNLLLLVIVECSSGPCQNQGVCADRDGGYVCYCPPGYSAEHCEKSKFRFGRPFSVSRLPVASYPCPQLDIRLSTLLFLWLQICVSPTRVSMADPVLSALTAQVTTFTVCVKGPFTESVVNKKVAPSNGTMV